MSFMLLLMIRFGGLANPPSSVLSLGGCADNIFNTRADH